ncbi:MAG: DUF5916 domain-containing protein [Pseudomonadales bacterium]
MRLRIVVGLCCAYGASAAPAFGQAAGDAEIIDTLEGVPRHHIVVENLLDADVDIILDGRVDEPIWRQLPYYDNMIVYVPGTGEPGSYRTETRMLATERGLYVSGVMYQPPESLSARLSRRDDFIDRDQYGITLDTTGEGLYAYWFMVGLGDSLGDGKLLPERNYERDWDGAWSARSATFDEGWSAELFLPWSMVDLPRTNGPRKIGFAITRGVAHADERYQWPGYPYSSSRFVTALNLMEISGVQPRTQLSLIPYATTTIDRARGDEEIRIGADFSWRPSPKLKLTGSAFPDFGAVEADNVVLNLTAFETFFPEKRLFFLEGNEVFQTTPRSSLGNISRTITNDNFATTSRQVFRSDFHPAPISLVNTRRIGGTANQVTVPEGVTPNYGERDLPTDLLGAAKITGTVGNLRYGALVAIEDDVEWLGSTDGLDSDIDIDASGRDFAIARFLYESVGASRKSIGYIGTLASGPLYDAMVHGVDGHYTSSAGHLIADVQLIASDVDHVSGYGAMLDVKYARGSRLQHKLELDYFDADIDVNDVGFLSRNDYVGGQYVLAYAKTRALGSINEILGTLVVRQQFNLSEGQVVDSGIFWRNSMVLPGRTTIKTAVAYLPTRWEDVDSRGNGAYKAQDRWWFDAQITTDASNKFSYSASAGALQEDLGDWTYSATAGVTIRASDRLSVDLDVRYKRRDGWIVYRGDRNFGSYHGPDLQPSLDLNWFIAPRHQLRVSLQWAGVRAEQREFLEIPAGDGKLVPADPDSEQDFNVSILTAQVRYRWEIAPLTDFYLVYNLGNNRPVDPDTGFSDLFKDAFDDPVVESFVAKLRYRFGT